MEVSIVIRTFNEERYLGLLLETLKSQHFDSDQMEIVVVDSGSTDRTLDIVKKHNVRLLEMPKESFTYSKSLNLGIHNSTGKWIVMLSAHAVPTSEDWLEHMVSHFVNDQVAGVYCRQVPWPDAPWDEKLRLDNMFSAQSKVFSMGNDYQNFAFSNAASCIRRQLFEQHPFVEIPAAEDREWAVWALQKQYTIVYDASVSVFHSHNEAPRKSARRLIDIAKSKDLRYNKRRTCFLTFGQAVGMGIRSIIKILRFKNCEGKRSKDIFNVISRAFWFFWDFNK